MIKTAKGVDYFDLDLTENGDTLTPEKIRHWMEAMDEVRHHSQVKCLLIRGNKELFCAGFELTFYIQAPDQGQMITAHLRLLRSFLEYLQTYPKPVLAFVEGQAMGGALGILAAADIVIATPTATFKLPETIMGIIPAVVSPFIIQRIGVAKVRYLALGGAYQAEQALQAGLVDECTEDGAARIAKWIFRLGHLAPHAVEAFKSLVHTHFSGAENYFEPAYQVMEELVASDEVKTRIKAFCDGFTPWGN